MERYVDVFSDSGWQIVELPALDDPPDGVFVEDNVFVYGDVAVIARSGAESRRGETVGIGQTLHDLGYEVAAIDAPGTLDGGDLLKVDTTVYARLGGRTNTAGIERLRTLIEPLGASVQPVPVPKRCISSRWSLRSPTERSSPPRRCSTTRRYSSRCI